MTAPGQRRVAAGALSDAQLLRYSRHILLDELGLEGQARLLGAHALVVGAGGLGSPVALYLGSAGVGRITVVDDDCVDVTNLQRQIAHNLARVGQPKAQSVQAAVAAMNPDAVVTPLVVRADAALLDVWVAKADVVVDCSDNFATRHAVNLACVRHKKPLVWGAAARMHGQIAVFDGRLPDCPCYACVFAQDDGAEDVQCATMGVFAPLVGMVGTMQAAEALKLLAGLGSSLSGRLLMVDARHMAFDDIALVQNPHCKACGGLPLR